MKGWARVFIRYLTRWHQAGTKYFIRYLTRRHQAGTKFLFAISPTGISASALRAYGVPAALKADAVVEIFASQNAKTNLRLSVQAHRRILFFADANKNICNYLLTH